MRKIQNIGIGADPEVFLIDAKGNPITAEGRIGGSKDVPKQMTGLREGFYIQEDNVAAEFNIPPSTRKDEFAINIQKALGYVRKLAKKQGLDVSIVSALHFPQEMLATPHARMLGCDPDINIWTMQPNPRPEPPKSLRTAAGHVHVSWTEPDDLQRQAMVKVLDVLLVIPSLLATEPNERRGLYGKAGAARLKWYGVEARALDNFWIEHKAYCNHVYDQVQRAAGWLNHGGDLLVESIDSYGDEIQETINTHDIDNALRLMDAFGVEAFPVRV